MRPTVRPSYDRPSIRPTFRPSTSALPRAGLSCRQNVICVSFNVSGRKDERVDGLSDGRSDERI